MGKRIDKVWCMFEQSGCFKNEFKKLGIEAVDLDIQNNYGETDYQIDLFAEIENAYRGGGESVFDEITQDELCFAFFPCIYFTGSTNPCYYTLENRNYKNLTLDEKLDKMLERSENRQYFYSLIIKLVGVCLKRGLSIIIENPYSSLHYLCNNFFKAPDIIDKDRTMRGDYFKKPTGYWFFNCEPTYGCSYQKNKEQKQVWKCKSGIKSGICSEERSMIAPEYAKNFICDFILGQPNENTQITLF